MFSYFGKLLFKHKSTIDIDVMVSLTFTFDFRRKKVELLDKII
jgi:hypothetical protein